MNNSTTNAFYSKSKEFLIQKIDSKELDLTIQQVLNSKITVAPFGDSWGYNFHPDISVKFTEEINNELMKIFIANL